MIIGVPKEIKDNEYRVSMTPGGVSLLVSSGHSVLVEAGAGEGSGFPDDDYAAVGARIVAQAAEAWSAEMVVKVKEPQSSEFGFLRQDQVLFTYLHLAAEEELTRALLESGTIGIAYETVEAADGHLPLLTPMSEVAGRMSVQVGAYYLERMNGGRGKLLGGVPGVRPADVIVIGGGVVGTNAAQMALGMGAHVAILDVNLERLRQLEEFMGGRLTTLYSNPLTVAQAVRRADLLIGAVLVAGARAPKLVTAEMVSTMKPGAVVIDVAVDQGGCIETTRPTSHSDPVFMVDGVLHYGVTNMPGAVPRTATYALSNATQRYVQALANRGAKTAVAADPVLAKGVNTWGGKLTYAAVADALGLPFTLLADLR